MRNSSQTPQVQPATGVLEGKVTIGPVYPHERQGISNEAGTDIYTAHRLAIFGQDGITKIKEVALDGRGAFKTDLPVGSYVLDVLPHDIGRAAFNRPQTVSIQPGQTTRADIDLDTGIQ